MIDRSQWIGSRRVLYCTFVVRTNQTTSNHKRHQSMNVCNEMIRQVCFLPVLNEIHNHIQYFVFCISYFVFSYFVFCIFYFRIFGIFCIFQFLPVWNLACQACVCIHSELGWDWDAAVRWRVVDEGIVAACRQAEVVTSERSELAPGLWSPGGELP